MFDRLRGRSPRSSLMEVKESEAQGRRREAGSVEWLTANVSIGSVERKREPMDKNRIARLFRDRTSWHASHDEVQIHQGSWQ